MIMMILTRFMAIFRTTVIAMRTAFFDDDDLQRHLIIELNGELLKARCQ